ncbi:MAG: hypothetical protein QOD53_1078 [Thermoleophilaceae bacterium]|jgi:hypothetical protein|nr:hypothetical protein [Thermoleophilaceae bacterium]
MASWAGEERRSPESISARTAVAARQQAKEFQEALQSVSPLRRARRRKLERELEQAVSREREALSILSGGSA